jgi:phosphoenolpyruvate-protein kinase (PTS system EI component)
MRHGDIADRGAFAQASGAAPSHVAILSRAGEMPDFKGQGNCVASISSRKEDSASLDLSRRKNRGFAELRGPT